MAPLQLSPEEFRKLADRVAAAATEFLATLDQRRIFPPTSGSRTAAVFERPAPEDGMGEAAFDALSEIAEHARAGAMAREAKAPANEQGAQACVVYASEEVHMSVPKALALLGVGRAPPASTQGP